MWQWSLLHHHYPPQKDIKYIHASASDLLHKVLDQEISIGANADIAKTKWDK